MQMRAASVGGLFLIIAEHIHQDGTARSHDFHGAPQIALTSIDAPDSSMMPSMTSRNTSGLSFTSSGLAMKAPAISEEPAIRPWIATSSVNAPKRWKVMAL